MTAPGGTPSRTGNVDAGIGYVRGGGVEVDSRRAKRVVVIFCVVVLAVLVVILTVTAVHKNHQIDRLAQHGVRVQVMVTDCLAMGSGTGATIVGYQCRGTFTLDGHLHRDVIGGSNIHRPAGQKVSGITDPSDPSLLSTARAVARTHASWTAYIAPGITLVVLLLVVGLVGWRIRRARRLAVIA